MSDKNEVDRITITIKFTKTTNSQIEQTTNNSNMILYSHISKLQSQRYMTYNFKL